MSLKKNLLIIFYRNPEPGKVKTRLAATLGDANALAVYLKLVTHTRGITENLNADKVVCYADFVDREDNWANEIYDKELQRGSDLGARLHAAMASGFEKRYKSICVIGTDCLELTTDVIEEAFEKLTSHDAVIGPAEDGGYYLLGTNQFIPILFSNKVWSSSTVASDTIRDLRKLNLSYALLPTLKDVDEEKDLPEALKRKLR
jgi:rSAM/selenodomain-associated transferase 1